MREIKFRAWDGKEMIYDDIGLSSGDIIDGYTNVMQFTGLKDKNGVEIYEGDIVRATFKGSFTNTVIFHNGCFKFNTGDNREPYIRLEQYKNNLEVIGNIYENGELMESEN